MYDYFVVVDNELADLRESNVICTRRMDDPRNIRNC